ncbi:MAG: hypothetical protein HYZ23_08295 [Chloroflexi bacterium]|nr:hypothetical protein [Chloroflexota bacterium]
MKSQYRMLFALAALLLAVSLACGGGGTVTQPTAVTIPTLPPAPTLPPLPTQNSNPIVPQPPALNNPPPSTGNTAGGSSDIVTFTDENGLLSFDVPGDWYYDHLTYESAYVDRITAPDGSAIIESLVYNDGQPFTGNDNGRFALQLLHQFYSSTGKEGDISISADEIQPDGSEKLTWKSKGGGYSGVSFFELRGSDRMTFLMFTLFYGNDADQSVIDTLSNAITTYTIP